MAAMWRAVFCLVLVAPSLGYEDKTVYQYLVDNGFTMFVSLLQASNQNTMLQGTGPFTVLAPVNSAFAKADPAFISSLTDVQMTKIVKYHLLNGFNLLPQLLFAQNVTTQEGQKVTVTSSGSTIKINNDSQVSSSNDIICNNGVIQPIDTLLMPPVFGVNNIAEILIMRDDKYRNFFLYLYFANMTRLLEGDEFTVFAPDDMAWGRIVEGIMHPPNVSQSFLYYNFIEMMKYHIVPGARTTEMLKTGQPIYTLHGYPLNVTVDGADIRVSYGKITEPNIPASNGVIHGVNNVLYPTDLLNMLLDELHIKHPPA